MTHEKDRPYNYLATSLNSLNLFSIGIYHYIKVNSLCCKEYKSLKTHKKLFLEKINSYFEKIDEIKSNCTSIFIAQVSGKTSIAVSINVPVNMNETYLQLFLRLRRDVVKNSWSLITGN